VQGDLPKIPFKYAFLLDLLNIKVEKRKQKPLPLVCEVVQNNPGWNYLPIDLHGQGRQ